MKNPVDVPGWPGVSKPVQLPVSGLISADITFRVGEMPRRAEKYRAEDVRFGLGGGAGACPATQGASRINAETPVSPAAMALASHIAFSRQGLRDYARHDGVEQGLRMAQKQFGCWVCVTDGEHGVTWLDHDQLAQGYPEHAAMVFANAAAALKCASADGLDGIPDESVVLALMQLHGM